MTDPNAGDTSAAAATAAAVPAAGSVGRASALLASGTIVSRLLGFVNGVVLAYAIGATGNGADSFALANQLPNNIYSLVAGGLLSAVIVPQIVKAALHLDGGQAFINKLVTLGLVVFAPVTILATLCAPLLATLYGAGNGGADVLALTTAFAYWCLPQIFFYAIYSLIGETLNARGVFGPFTWTPALNNVVVIAGLVVFIVLFGRGHEDAGTWTLAQVAVLAGSATLGIAVQAFGLLFFWRRAGLAPYRPDFRWRGVGLGATGRSAAWVFGMFLVSQVSGVVEAQVAFGASGSDASLAALKYAWLMFMLPHSVRHRLGHNRLLHADERTRARRRARARARGPRRGAAHDPVVHGVLRSGPRRARLPVLRGVRGCRGDRPRLPRLPGGSRALDDLLRAAARVLRRRGHPRRVPHPGRADRVLLRGRARDRRDRCRRRGSPSPSRCGPRSPSSCRPCSRGSSCAGGSAASARSR